MKFKKTKNPSNFIFSDINLLISELEDLKLNLKPNPNMKELRISVKNINKLSEKIITKLLKRINDEIELGN